jgi:hypothetical protein
MEEQKNEACKCKRTKRKRWVEICFFWRIEDWSVAEISIRNVQYLRMFNFLQLLLLISTDDLEL